MLPFARCQPMNSVCLGRRAHTGTQARVYRALSKACISIGIRWSFFPEGVLGLMLGEQPGRDGKMKSTLRSKVIRANVCDVKPRRHSARRSCPLDLSRELLLTFNGPILCRPILRRRGQHLKLIVVCHVGIAVKIVTTLHVAALTRGEDLIEARFLFFFSSVHP